MKILLAAINAKYIHSNLAVYCLRAYALKHLRDNNMDFPVNIEIAEYTINQRPDDIMRDIYERKADILCYSCYIWNLDYVERLVKDVGKICKELPVWLGGPEVSYDALDVLRRLPEVKGVIKGEGEITFLEVVKAYLEVEAANEFEESLDKKLAKIEGITYREAVCPSGDGEVAENPWREPMDLSLVPFVYEDMEEFEHKIVYYETSRGCPFLCSYCLSSIDKKLRFRSLELVRRELQFFIDHKVPQVKFVDRTFNCSHEHAMAVWSYIAEHDNGVTNFHFEVSADLLNEEELKLIERMRPGLIQLEVGVQSTNPDTVKEIRRTMNLDRLRKSVLRIEAAGNVHQHLDLIAGLPYEDIESFARSFDDIYAMRPQQLQLGFLKVLKGSYMEKQKEDYQLIYQSGPPYEVLSTRWLPYEDILRLKGIEEMVETYYNSRQFEKTMEELCREYASAFTMYEKLWTYYKENGFHNVQHKRSARYELLLAFVTERHPQKAGCYRELLIYDYYLRENAKTRPAFAGESMLEKEEVRTFYEREEKKRIYLPGYDRYDKNQMRKMTHLERFPQLGKTVLFDYLARNPLNQEARTCAVDIC